MVSIPKQGQNILIFKINEKEVKIGQKKGKKRGRPRQTWRCTEEKELQVRGFFAGTEAIGEILLFIIFSSCPGSDDNADYADDGDDDDDDDDGGGDIKINIMMMMMMMTMRKMPITPQIWMSPLLPLEVSNKLSTPIERK